MCNCLCTDINHIMLAGSKNKIGFLFLVVLFCVVLFYLGGQGRLARREDFYLGLEGQVGYGNGGEREEIIPRRENIRSENSNKIMTHCTPFHPPSHPFIQQTFME